MCLIEVYYQGVSVFISSWQRGRNDNGNGLLREFFPKKTNFDPVTLDDMNQALHLNIL